MFEQWNIFCTKPCPQCEKPLVSDSAKTLVFEDGCWYHESCFLKAKRMLAQANKLASYSMMTLEYEKTVGHLERR